MFFLLILICFWTLVSGLCAGKLIFSRQFRRRSHFKIVRNWDTLLLHKQTNMFGKKKLCFILTKTAIEYYSMFLKMTYVTFSQTFKLILLSKKGNEMVYRQQSLVWFQNKTVPRRLHLWIYRCKVWFGIEPKLTEEGRICQGHTTAAGWMNQNRSKKVEFVRDTTEAGWMNQNQSKKVEFVRYYRSRVNEPKPIEEDRICETYYSSRVNEPKPIEEGRICEILQKPGGRSPWRFSCRSRTGRAGKA